MLVLFWETFCAGTIARRNRIGFGQEKDPILDIETMSNEVEGTRTIKPAVQLEFPMPSQRSLPSAEIPFPIRPYQLVEMDQFFTSRIFLI